MTCLIFVSTALRKVILHPLHTPSFSPPSFSVEKITGFDGGGGIHKFDWSLNDK